jgi:hypothetical protein
MHLKVCSHIHTNAVDIELDFGAQKLVPLVNGPRKSQCDRRDA